MSWLKYKKTAQRRVVFVDGWERYLAPRVRRWWIEARDTRRIVELKSPTVDQILNLVEPGLLEQPVNVLVQKFEPEPDDLDRLLSVLLPLQSGLLVYLSSSFELSVKEQLLVKKRRSSRFGFIELKWMRWYDRRKRTWLAEILRQHGILLDDRARNYLIDWCRWSMEKIEAQAIRLSLLLDPGVPVPLGHLRKYLPPEDYTRDIVRLMRVKTDGYYMSFESQLQGATNHDRRRFLNQHLRLLDQIRVLLLVKKGDQDQEAEDAQYEKLKKISRYPLTRLQYNALVRGPDISKYDCLDFLARSCSLITNHFSGAVA